MKPVAFDYVRPTSISEACALLAGDDGARIIAGGQTLIPMLAMRLARPTRLVDIARIPDLAFIRDEGEGVTIGAVTRQSVAERDPIVGTKLPLLAKALPWVGHRATRVRGTVGGSIANGDPAGEIPLVAVTLRATITVQDASGVADLAAGEFYLGSMITALPEGAIVTSVRFPVWTKGRVGAGFHEVSARRNDFALVASAAQVALDADGRCTALSVGIGGAADTPVRLEAVSEALLGSRLDEAVVQRAVVAGLDDLATLDDLHASAAYRKRVATTVARRAILEARQEALGGQHAR